MGTTASAASWRTWGGQRLYNTFGPGLFRPLGKRQLPVGGPGEARGFTIHLIRPFGEATVKIADS
jgi:hypothetical protein